MSIFSRRKRTRHLASLAISSVAISLCSSQVALCSIWKIESFCVDRKNMCIYIYAHNESDDDATVLTKILGGYECYFTSSYHSFVSMIDENNISRDRIFSAGTPIKYELSLENDGLNDSINNDGLNDSINNGDDLICLMCSMAAEAEDARKEHEKYKQAELKRRQEEEQHRKQHGNNVEKIHNLIKEYERHDGYDVRKYSIEINANGDFGLKEDFRNIILCDPIIQENLKYIGRSSIIEMINKKLREITIARKGDKYFIEVKLA